MNTATIQNTEHFDKEIFNQWFDERTAEKEAAHTPSLSIISTKGTLDMAYPPFILASTASALGWDVSIFFTFYGLNLLRKDPDLKISPLGNPAMPMKMPMGPEWLQNMDMNVPNIVQSNMPGYEAMASALMKKTMENKGVATIQDLREACIEADVNLLACQMTVDLFGMNEKEFIPEVTEWVGAASFLPEAQKSDICLFI